MRHRARWPQKVRENQQQWGLYMSAESPQGHQAAIRGGRRRSRLISSGAPRPGHNGGASRAGTGQLTVRAGATMGCMITAADVGTLLFDVIGTVVDEGGTMRAEVAEVLGGPEGPDAALAAAWEQRSWSLTAELGDGGTWVSTDEVNARALAEVLAGSGGPQLSADA